MLTTLRFALVLTVAAIPVAMPTVLSATMAVDAKLLAAKQAIVRRLASIEELAGIDILCSDKTGTLTQNKLTLGEPVALAKASSEEIILAGALASRAEDKDVIDLTVISGLKDPQVMNTYQVVHFQPFDPVHKRTEATVKDSSGKTFKVSKGAPQAIFELATNKSDIQNNLEKTVNEFAGKGYRSLGVARTDEKDQWQYLGILPLFDIPREDSKATIDAARQMGTVRLVVRDTRAVNINTAEDGCGLRRSEDASVQPSMWMTSLYRDSMNLRKNIVHQKMGLS